MLVCTSEQTAPSRYLSLSRASKSLGRASSLLRGSRGGYRRKAQNLQRLVSRLSPLLAGCPHPSRCSAKAQHRATFPKGKAKAALESQTPQREPRRLRRKPQIRFAAFPRFTCKALFVRFLSPLRARQRPAGYFPARSLCAGRCPPSPGGSPWL